MDAVASRYALAISKIASEQSALKAYFSLFKDLKDVVINNDLFLKFLGNEFYGQSDKEQFIDQVFPVTTWLLIPSMLKVMLAYRRMTLLPLVIDQAMLMLQNLLKQQEGLIYSAFPLTTQQIQDLQTVMSGHMKQPVTLTAVIDTNILGGFRIDIGDKVFDASVVSQLASLKQMLLKRGS
jgi:F-type H+-transporting ATPase subunit delta